MSIALIDYNMGNLGSVAKALEFVGARAEVVSSGKELTGFDCCLLPGVGNFGDGMENLKRLRPGAPGICGKRRLVPRDLPRYADAA